MTFSAQAAETELRSSTKPPYLTPKFRQKGAALTTKVQHKTSLPPMTTETPQDLKSLGFSPPSAGYPGIPELNHKTLSNSPRTPTQSHDIFQLDKQQELDSGAEESHQTSQLTQKCLPRRCHASSPTQHCLPPTHLAQEWPWRGEKANLVGAQAWVYGGVWGWL